LPTHTYDNLRKCTKFNLQI